jgi:photosystem I reaction center subunit XII
MPLSDTQILIALVVALFPGVMALMLGTALADS